MDKYEQQREEQRAKIEQHEKRLFEKQQSKIQNIKSFDEIYNTEFFKALKNKKMTNGTFWTNVFDQNMPLDLLPVDCVLADNLQNDKAKIDQILMDNVGQQIKKYNDFKMQIEPMYVHAFVYDYDAMLSSIVSVSKIKSKHGMYSSDTWCEPIKANGTKKVANLDKYTNELQIDIESFEQNNSPILQIKKTNKNANALFKQIKKEIVDGAKQYKNANAFFSSIVLYDINIRHVLLKIYKVKFCKFLSKKTYLIYSNTLECKSI